MNFNNFTIKAQEAVQQALQIASGNNQQSIETAHLMKGLLSEAENVTAFLLQKTGVNVAYFTKELDRIINGFPKVTGGEPFLSSATNTTVQKATSLSQKMGAKFVSVEHLLLALLETGDAVSKLMKEQGVPSSVCSPHRRFRAEPEANVRLKQICPPFFGRG